MTTASSGTHEWRGLCRRWIWLGAWIAPLIGAHATAAALSDEDCFRELASVDYGHSSESLENNRFRHVFQHIDEFPYYRIVEGVFVGIKTDRGEPRARVPNRNYWSYVQGRSGVGASDNYSLFHDIRGETDVQGVPVQIDVGGDFAFFLYPGSANDATTFPAQAARTGGFRVLATMGDGVEFLPTRASGRWRLGDNTVLRLYSSRFSQCDIWCDGQYDGKYLRTVFMLHHAVTVGGETYRKDKICRLRYYPLVVTNSTALLAAVETELAARADRIHTTRIVNGRVRASADQWKAAFARVDPAVLVKVATMPRDHRGDFAVDTAFGTVAIRFTRDLSEDNDDIRTTAFYRGSYRYWRHAIVGRLVVAGQDLGAVTEVKLGEINHGRALRRRVLDQNFRSVGAMERNDNGELRCHEDGCDIVVRRRLLRTP